MRTLTAPSPQATPPDERTRYALDRTVLAKERSFAAWIRTGLTGLVSGVVIENLMADGFLSWGIHAISATLIAFSGVAFFTAAWSHRRFNTRMGHPDIAPLPGLLTSLSSYLLIGVSMVAMAAIFAPHV